MLYDEIIKVRNELNNAIKNSEDYSTIYEISVKLDNLIAEYYQLRINNSSKV